MDGSCCCQFFFLILITVFVGFLLGVFIAGEYDIDGLPELWRKFTGLFKSSQGAQPNQSSTTRATGLLLTN